MVVTPAVADLVLNFDNDRPDASTLPAYITFTGALPGQFDATIAGTSTQLQEGVSYSLSTLAAGVDVTQYTSGRVFVSLGSPLTDLSAGNQYAPNFRPTIAASAKPEFPDENGQIRNHLQRPRAQRRRIARPAGANLSSTDFFGIPLQLQTKGGSSADDAHLELQRRRQHRRGLPGPRRPGEFPDRHSLPTPSAPSSRAARTASRSTRPTDP